ncbi:MAG: transcription antitermination factor NusB [Prevotellaceae bacterium]|jgi:N utilization substance protein B|nr:transcription antitermination factor NusB [Prevotellaceae bacterium]
MINRVLLRIKIVQILYSFYKGGNHSLSLAEKELLFSIEKTYDLYFHLLQLSIEITRYADLRIDAGRNKLVPTKEDLHPNTRFVENKFIRQLEANKQLKDYFSKRKLSWVNYQDIIKSMYEKIIASGFYSEYMNADTTTYEADKSIWRKIYKKIILSDKELEESLEEQSIYWFDDIELVVSFIIKTIKHFESEKEDNQALMPKFRGEQDWEFAKELLTQTISRSDEYQELISRFTKNWDYDRIAFMDILILKIALAEIINFPTIPINVSLNEYIEIAKFYSTEKSANFVNGILDNIVNFLKSENKLTKVVMFNSK